jgi:hypothetical protein
MSEDTLTGFYLFEVSYKNSYTGKGKVPVLN